MIANRIAEIITAADRIVHPGHYRLISLWKNLGVPHRPNKEEIEIYKKFLGTITSKDRILILGATPELRDLIIGLGAKPHVADYSPEMLTAMQLLMVENTEGKETKLQKNWLDLDFSENFFTAVIGDLSLRHLKSPQQSLLLERISNWLKPDGTTILRMHFVNPHHAKRSYLEILDGIKENHNSDSLLSVMSMLLSQLYDASTRDNAIDRQSIERGVRDYLLKTDIQFSYRVFLHEFLKKRVVPFSKPLASQTKELYKKLFSTFYTVNSSAHAGNYLESEHYPIYSLIPHK